MEKLIKQKGFLKAEDRKTLLDELKKSFRLNDAIKGYNSCLLELTYIAGDVSRVKKTRPNQEDGSLHRALKELDEWHRLLGIGEYGEEDRQALVEFMLRAKDRAWIRQKFAQRVEGLDEQRQSSIVNINKLMKDRHEALEA